MTTLVVTDLEQGALQDAQALQTLQGGSSAVQGIGNGGVFGLALVEGGGILSPTINVQTIVSTPVNVQLTNILEHMQQIDITNIVASAVANA